MYQIRQFKPTLYLLLLLGMAGFAVAAQSILALVLGCGGILINAWLVYTGRFRPLPRMVANVITIGAMVLVVRQLMNLRTGGSGALDPGGNPVLIIGHFLVILQLVKLWEQRLNRDYAQLLVLSLLQVVAAAINTNLLAFGLLLLVYLFLALYCCLLYHLKVETDRARESMLSPPDLAPVAVPLPDQRRLSRSMRQMTWVVASWAVVTAVVTFLFFPRGNGTGLLSPGNFSHTLAQTGYSAQLRLDPYNTSLETDEQVIAHARITRNGNELGIGDTVYLRGVSMNWYMPVGHGSGEFQRAASDTSPVGVPGDTEIALRFPSGKLGPDGTRERPQTVYTQDMVLSPTGTHVLFFVSATAGSGQRSASAFTLVARRELRVKLGDDGAVQTDDALTTPIEYDASTDDGPVGRVAGELTSGPVLTEETLVPGQLPVTAAASPGLPELPAGTPAVVVATRGHLGVRQGDYIVAIDGRPVGNIPNEQRRVEEVAKAHQLVRSLTVVHNGSTFVVPAIPPEVAAYARRPDVSGSDALGPLADRRDRTHLTDPLDLQIAKNIEHHLRTQFSYTMNISDAKTRADLDPIVWFLSDDGRRGHCEYFAAAMTLMCQSLGIQARVVSGYRCDEYNDFSHRFIIRQSQAHAWVEINTDDGWRTFDPTSGRDAAGARSDSSLWQKVKHLFDWLESSYANHIIYYSNDSRDNLIQSMEAQMTKPLYRAVNDGWITPRFKDSKIYGVLAHPGGRTIAWIAAAVLLIVSPWMGRRLWRWYHLRQRAERIGLDALPPAEQLRLARQLGFYDDLLRLLERRRITRKPHETPLEFAKSLLYLPSDAYEAILRLTSIFYRVRYGKQSLSPGLQDRLQSVITRLDGELAKG